MASIKRRDQPTGKNCVTCATEPTGIGENHDFVMECQFEKKVIFLLPLIKSNRKLGNAVANIQWNCYP